VLEGQFIELYIERYMNRKIRLFFGLRSDPVGEIGRRSTNQASTSGVDEKLSVDARSYFNGSVT
jgi:hypothetical protein